MRVLPIRPPTNVRAWTMSGRAMQLRQGAKNASLNKIEERCRYLRALVIA